MTRRKAEKGGAGLMTENIGAFDPALLTDAPREFAATADDILGLVSVRFQVPLVQLIGRRRTQHVAFVRQMAMYLARELTDLSFPEIGDAFGRDHSTVIHACNLIARRMDARSDFKARIEGLKAEVETCPLKVDVGQ
jgi:chromosomal replication initiator protein